MAGRISEALSPLSSFFASLRDVVPSRATNGKKSRAKAQSRKGGEFFSPLALLSVHCRLWLQCGVTRRARFLRGLYTRVVPNLENKSKSGKYFAKNFFPAALCD
jgi:hypothetical protein